MKYITEKYNSLLDFKKSLERESVGYTAKEFNPDFIGCQSEEKANELLLNGDQKSVRMINEKQKKSFVQSKNKLYKSNIGFTPCMGAVMAGHPCNMYNIRSVKYKDSKIINIFYALDVDWRVNHKDIAAVGAKILNVVASLEHIGYRVNLYVTSVSHPVIGAKRKCDFNKLLSLFIRIKESGKQLNISKIAFPLANPAFYRWFSFKWNNTVCKDIVNTVVLTTEDYIFKYKESICKNFRFTEKDFIIESYYTLKNKSETAIMKDILR